MDKPGALCWFFGKLTIVGLVMLLIGAVIYWTFMEKKGIIYEMQEWTPEIKYLIVITYFYLICSYFLTILSVAYVFESPKILELMAMCPKSVIIISLVSMTVLTALLEHIPYADKTTLLKNGLWILHSLIMGPAFAYFGTYISVETSIKTSLALILATIISFTAPKYTFNNLKQHIQALYSAVTICSILCFLFNPPVNTVGLLLLTCNLCGGMILYFGVFITNTQVMLNQVTESDYDPVYTAAVMYLSTLNLYLRAAMFYVVELTNITSKEENCAQGNSQ